MRDPTAEGRQAVTDNDRQRITALRRRIERLNLDEQARLEAAFPVLCHLLEEEP